MTYCARYRFKLLSPLEIDKGTPLDVALISLSIFERRKGFNLKRPPCTRCLATQRNPPGDRPSAADPRPADEPPTGRLNLIHMNPMRLIDQFKEVAAIQAEAKALSRRVDKNKSCTICTNFARVAVPCSADVSPFYAEHLDEESALSP
jgi:hypothetical protein